MPGLLIAPHIARGASPTVATAFGVACGTLQVNLTTVGNTFSVSNLAFQPKVLYFWWNGRDDATDAQGEADHHRGIGCAISTTQRGCVGSFATNNAAAAANEQSVRNDAVMAILTATGGDGLMDLDAITSDGFRLIVDNATAAAFALDIEWVAWGGSEITDTGYAELSTPGVAGNWDTTSLSFQPTFVSFLGTPFSGALPQSNGADTSTGFGWARVDADGTSNIAQGVWVGGANDGALDMQTISYCNDAECYAAFNTTPSGLFVRETFVQALSNGFRLNQTGTEVNLKILAIAVKAGSANIKAGSLLTRTDGADIVVSSVGHQPKGLLFLSHCKTESTPGTVQDDDEWSMGCATSATERVARGVIDNDADADSNIGTAVEYDEVYINQDVSDPPVIEGLMDLKSIESNGFTCVMDDTDPAAAFVLWLSVGDAPAVAAALRSPYYASYYHHVLVLQDEEDDE